APPCRAARSPAARRSAGGCPRRRALGAPARRRDGAAPAAWRRARPRRGSPAPRVAPRSCGCGRAPSLGPWELERAKRVERLVVGQIEVDGRDRDEAVADGVEVGPLGILERELVAADPVVLL